MERSNKIQILLKYCLAGAVLFYLIVHPFTMVLYKFEHHKNELSFSSFISTFKNQFLKSFDFSMSLMAVFMTVFGAILGLIIAVFFMRFKKSLKLISDQNDLLVDNVVELIQKGESDKVEFKSSVRYDYHKGTPNKDLELVIAKTIVGFLNCEGGNLIVGVDDSGQILGLEKDYKTLKNKNRDGFEMKIHEIIANFIDKRASFNVRVLLYQIDQKDLALIHIKKSNQPVYLLHKNDTIFYVRMANSTQALSVKDAVKYISERANS